jgi:hypothetical protein
VQGVSTVRKVVCDGDGGEVHRKQLPKFFPLPPPRELTATIYVTLYCTSTKKEKYSRLLDLSTYFMIVYSIVMKVTVYLVTYQF